MASPARELLAATLDASDVRARALLRMIRQRGPSSRSELRDATGVHPNLIGDAVARLAAWRVVRDCAATLAPRAGRPQVKLELDPRSRRAVGIAIGPGRVTCASLWLDGSTRPLEIGEAVAVDAFLARPMRAVRAVAGDDVLAVGVSCTGFLDVAARRVLFSSASGAGASLGRLVTAIRSAMPAVPVRLTNDMHALSARYALAHASAAVGDTLLIGMDDGKIGASALVDGRPNRGCVLAANELGHARLAVKTARCYCGETGCVERIFSTAWLRSIGARASLGELVRRGEPTPELARCLDLTTRAFGNAANFLRPHRVVLAGPFAGDAAFVAGFAGRLRRELLPVLRDRVAIESWAMPQVEASDNASDNAAWAGLAAWLDGETDA